LEPISFGGDELCESGFTEEVSVCESGKELAIGLGMKILVLEKFKRPMSDMEEIGLNFWFFAIRIFY